MTKNTRPPQATVSDAGQSSSSEQMLTPTRTPSQNSLSSDMSDMFVEVSGSAMSRKAMDSQWVSAGALDDLDLEALQAMVCIVASVQASPVPASASNANIFQSIPVESSAIDETPVDDDLVSKITAKMKSDLLSAPTAPIPGVARPQPVVVGPAPVVTHPRKLNADSSLADFCLANLPSAPGKSIPGVARPQPVLVGPAPVVADPTFGLASHPSMSSNEKFSYHLRHNRQPIYSAPQQLSHSAPQPPSPSPVRSSFKIAKLPGRSKPDTTGAKHRLPIGIPQTEIRHLSAADVASIQDTREEQRAAARRAAVASASNHAEALRSELRMNHDEQHAALRRQHDAVHCSFAPHVDRTFTWGPAVHRATVRGPTARRTPGSSIITFGNLENQQSAPTRQPIPAQHQSGNATSTAAAEADTENTIGSVSEMFKPLSVAVSDMWHGLCNHYYFVTRPSSSDESDDFHESQGPNIPWLAVFLLFVVLPITMCTFAFNKEVPVKSVAIIGKCPSLF